MARHFVFSNGNILIGLDEHCQLRDFFFPFVGEENHVRGKVHRFGVWIDGSFRWINHPSWKKKLKYLPESLVSNVHAHNNELELNLVINDGVYPSSNVFLRKITVQNKTNRPRSVKLFFHQNFDILGDNIGDTVYFNPIVTALINYKGKRYFLMNGSMYDKVAKKSKGFSSYTTGLTEEYGLAGTYVDAEDGILSKNPIEHGSVDSVLSFDFSLAPQKEQEVYFWICVGTNHGEVEKLNDFVKSNKPDRLLDQTNNYWKTWVNRTPFKYIGLNTKIIDLFKRSLLFVSTHVDQHGAFIASSDSDMLQHRKDTYSYMWPRDGALIARSLDRAGYAELTESFFQFCCDSLSPEGFLFHKYRPDGSLGSSWHSWLKEGNLQLPIQEDQIALVLDALWKHYLQHKNEEYAKKIFKCFRKAADFMAHFIDEKTGLPKESYDLWEEKLGIHTFTCATVYAGLKAAAKFEHHFGAKTREKKYKSAAESIKNAILNYLYDEEEGYFIKGLYYEKGELKRDMTIDSSSMYGIVQFGVLDGKDERAKLSIKKFKERLYCKTNVGGYARYENDYYYRISKEVPGNPWFITTLWLAEYYISIAQTQEELAPAIDIFEWVTRHALETKVLSEQLNPYTGAPLSVAPLTWSHAAFVVAIIKYLEKLDSLGICKMCNPPGVTNKNEKTNKRRKG